MNDHEVANYSATMHGIATYAATLREGCVDGREVSEREREDIECRIARLLHTAIETRRGKVGRDEITMHGVEMMPIQDGARDCPPF